MPAHIQHHFPTLKGLFMYALFVLYTAGCSVNADQTQAFQPATIDHQKIKEHIHSQLTEKSWQSESSNPSVLADFDSAAHYIKTWYQQQNYIPRWHQTEQDSNRLKNFRSYLQEVSTLGLQPEYYLDFAKITEGAIETGIARQDITASLNYFMLALHLYRGVVDPSQFTDIVERKQISEQFLSEVKQGLTSNDWMSFLAKLQPRHLDYRNLQPKAAQYLTENEPDTSTTTVPVFKEDTVGSIRQTKIALRRLKYLTSDRIDNDSNWRSALKIFQHEHGLQPDGIVGKQTAAQLKLSISVHRNKLIANLERMRWNHSWPDRYIMVNVPAYELRFFNRDKIEVTHKVVAGTKSTPTPDIRSKLQYMVTYPYWNIPYSISSKEILPNIKRDSTYLARKNYKLFAKSGDEVDPSTIDWSDVSAESFKWRIRQEGGSFNALGLIKFIFPNRHAVFLHDTPDKKYFYRDQRAYSHGCMRLQNPLDLAAHILLSDQNKISIDTVKSRIRNKQNSKVHLRNPLDVIVQYYTASADSNHLYFYDDVYGNDSALIEALKP